MSNPAIRRGCRGYIVKDIQEELEITKDGDFGGKTESALKKRQSELNFLPTGEADKATFDILNLNFPSEFERCLQITDSFEGTGFGGINKRDIDGAGVTLGIVGFTTAHGEVQSLVKDFIKVRPDVLDTVPAVMRERLLKLCADKGKNTLSWDNWFYGNDEVVDLWIRQLVATWGDMVDFQDLQMARIQPMWDKVLLTAEKLGVKSLEAKALLFDIRVQNGGWAARHQRHYKPAKGDSEKDRMKLIVSAVAKECAPKWRKDVLIRKNVFVDGTGVVHGKAHDLLNFGF